MAFREAVAHSWTSSWVTSAVCVMPPEVNFRDSASCRRGSGCCASTNSAKYLCKAWNISGLYKAPVGRIHLKTTSSQGLC